MVVQRLRSGTSLPTLEGEKKKLERFFQVRVCLELEGLKVEGLWEKMCLQVDNFPFIWATLEWPAMAALMTTAELKQF